MFGTSGDIIMNVGGIPCAHLGCSVHRRLNTISTLGEGGISRVHWEMFSTSEGYHDAFGGAT